MAANMPCTVEVGKKSTIMPAAGPLMVSSELLISVVRIEPTIAVKTPAIGG
jgi:hypothetical protein